MLKTEAKNNMSKAKVAPTDNRGARLNPWEVEANSMTSKLLLGELVQHSRLNASERLEIILSALNRLVARVDGKLY